MNAGTRSPKVTLIDLMGPSRPTPVRMVPVPRRIARRMRSHA